MNMNSRRAVKPNPPGKMKLEGWGGYVLFAIIGIAMLVVVVTA